MNFLAAQGFRTGGLAGGRSYNAIESPGRPRRDRRAIEDAAGVDVHVLAHPPPGLGIGADLDHRRDRRANDRAAAGGEQRHVGPEAIISTISALSEMLGKPKRGSPSGTTSIRWRPSRVDLARLDQAANRRSAALEYAPSDFSSIVVSPSAFPGAKLLWPWRCSSEPPSRPRR